MMDWAKVAAFLRKQSDNEFDKVQRWDVKPGGHENAMQCRLLAELYMTLAAALEAGQR